MAASLTKEKYEALYAEGKYCSSCGETKSPKEFVRYTPKRKSFYYLRAPCKECKAKQDYKRRLQIRLRKMTLDELLLLTTLLQIEVDRKLEVKYGQYQESTQKTKGR